MTRDDNGDRKGTQRPSVRYGWISFLALIGLVACQPAPRVFKPLAATDHRSTVRMVVINYLIENPPDFATIYYSPSAWRCTSSLVGTKVLLTAAHCVPAGGGQVMVDTPSGQIAATCTPSQVVDVALCSLKDEPPVTLHETVNSDAGLLHEKETLLLSGFGCTQPHGANGYDPEFRIGLTSITELPAGERSTIGTTGGAATCGGDSGAPGFAIDPAAASNPFAAGAFTRRLVVGVSVKGDEDTSSTLVSTSAPAVQSFFKGWTETTGFKICGFSPEAQACRTPP